MEQLPLPDRRGVESFELTGMLVLVRAPLEAVSGAFREQLPDALIRESALDAEVPVADRSFVAAQLRGHDWAFLWGLTPALFNTQERTQDALALSGMLQTEALFFATSGEAGAMVYHYYREGGLLEMLDVVPASLLDDIEAQLDAEDELAREQVAAMRAAGGRTFVSGLREEDPAVIGDVRAFVRSFFAEQGIYVPPLHTPVAEPGETFRVSIPGIEPADVRGADFISLP